MTHGPHEGREGAILFDRCPECDRRAKEPLDALLRLDPETFGRLWQRMLSVEYGDGPLGSGDGSYLSLNEARVGKALYYVSLVIERNAPTLVEFFARSVARHPDLSEDQDREQ